MHSADKVSSPGYRPNCNNNCSNIDNGSGYKYEMNINNNNNTIESNKYFVRDSEQFKNADAKLCGRIDNSKQTPQVESHHISVYKSRNRNNGKNMEKKSNTEHIERNSSYQGFNYNNEWSSGCRIEQNQPPPYYNYPERTPIHSQDDRYYPESEYHQSYSISQTPLSQNGYYNESFEAEGKSFISNTTPYSPISPYPPRDHSTPDPGLNSAYDTYQSPQYEPVHRPSSTNSSMNRHKLPSVIQTSPVPHSYVNYNYPPMPQRDGDTTHYQNKHSSSSISQPMECLNTSSNSSQQNNPLSSSADSSELYTNSSTLLPLGTASNRAESTSEMGTLNNESMEHINAKNLTVAGRGSVESGKDLWTRSKDPMLADRGPMDPGVEHIEAGDQVLAGRGTLASGVEWTWAYPTIDPLQEVRASDICFLVLELLLSRLC